MFSCVKEFLFIREKLLKDRTLKKICRIKRSSPNHFSLLDLVYECPNFVGIREVKGMYVYVCKANNMFFQFKFTHFTIHMCCS